MNSWKLYSDLKEMETKDIKTIVYASIRYLVKARREELKDIIKDIKVINKNLDKEV